MADNKTTRRAVIAGTAPIAAEMALVPFLRRTPAAAAVTAPERDPDAALLALRPEWLRTRQACEDALDLKSQVDERVFSRCPAYPDFKAWTGTCAEFSAECARVTAIRDVIEAEEGADVTNRLELETANANGEVVERIVANPARTLRGLAFKVEVSEDWTHDKPELTQSIMDDILKLASNA